MKKIKCEHCNFLGNTSALLFIAIQLPLYKCDFITAVDDWCASFVNVQSIMLRNEWILHQKTLRIACFERIATGGETLNKDVLSFEEHIFYNGL